MFQINPIWEKIQTLFEQRGLLRIYFSFIIIHPFDSTTASDQISVPGHFESHVICFCLRIMRQFDFPGYISYFVFSAIFHCFKICLNTHLDAKFEH